MIDVSAARWGRPDFPRGGPVVIEQMGPGLMVLDFGRVIT